MSKILTIFVRFDGQNRFTPNKLVESTEQVPGWDVRYVGLVPSKEYPVPAGFERILVDDHSQTLIEMNEAVERHNSDMVCQLTYTSWFVEQEFVTYVNSLENSEAIFAYCDSVRVTEFGTPIRHLFMPPPNHCLMAVLNPTTRGGLMHVARFKQLFTPVDYPFNVDGDMIGMASYLRAVFNYKGESSVLHVPEVTMRWSARTSEIAEDGFTWPSGRLPFSAQAVLSATNLRGVRTKVTNMMGLPSLWSVFSGGMPKTQLVIRNVTEQYQINRITRWINEAALRQMHAKYIISTKHLDMPNGFTNIVDANQVASVDSLIRAPGVEYTMLVDADRVIDNPSYVIMAHAVCAMGMGDANIVGFRSFINDSCAYRLGWEIDKERDRLIPIISDTPAFPSPAGPFGIYTLPHNISVANADLLVIKNRDDYPTLDASMPNLYLHNLCIQQPGKVVYSPVALCDGKPANPGSIPMDEYARMMSNAAMDHSFRYYSERMLNSRE